MAKVTFLPSNVSIEVAPKTKILAAALRAKVSIQYGCAACSCGTCGIRVKTRGAISPMELDEEALLTKMGLDTSGEIRLACRARILDGEIDVDLSFQGTYSPDQSY